MQAGGLTQKGLAGIATFGEHAWGATCDPAASPEDGSRLVLMLGQPYGLAGLITAGAGLGVRKENALFGAGILHSGSGMFGLTRLGVSAGLALHQRLRAGCGLSLLMLRWSRELSSLLSPGLTLSLQYTVDQKLSLQTMAVTGRFPTRQPGGADLMLRLFSGAKYNVAESFVLRIELERTMSGQLCFRGGLEARAGKHHRILAGADPVTQRFSIGWAWMFGRSVMGIAAEHHPLLGNSPWLTWEQGFGKYE